MQLFPPTVKNIERLPVFKNESECTWNFQKSRAAGAFGEIYDVPPNS